MPTNINPSNQTITQYNVQTGGANNLLNNVAPSATSGVPVISQGASAQPIFGTAAIAGGGTNATSMSTSTGIVKYDGTSLVTSSTAKISSGNVMTNTSQPCFLVTANAQANLTGDATVATVTFANTVFDNGSNFSSTTFTAPVTGRYLFCVNAMFTGIGAADSACLVRLTTTGGTYQGGGFNATTVKDASNILRTGFSVVVPMTATDTATVAIYAAGGTKAVGAGATDTNFSGYLVC